MNIEQYVILFCYALLLFNGASTYGALILMAAYCVYSLLVIPLPGEYYYAVTALLNTAVGYVLIKRHFYAALCSFSLIGVNVYGFMLFYSYQPPVKYDNISLLILIIQLILMLPKGLLNGFNIRRRSDKRPVVWRPDFDRSQARDIMHTNKTKKSKNR